MDWDSDGRPISVRGRRVRMTREDVVAFLKAVAEAFPSARFFHSEGRDDEPPLLEIPREDPAIPAQGLGEVSILFVGPAWQPEYHPARRRMLVNFPRLNASIWPAEFSSLEIEEIGCKIVRCDEGLLNANHYADEPGGKDGKRVIDKLFRLHRKLVDNKVVPIDLRTGEVAGEMETDYEWHGADMAQQCLDMQDHYLDISLSRENDRFWGYKPVRVPGKPTD